MWGQSGKNRARRPAERKDHCSARILSTNRRVGFPDDNISTKPSYSEHPKATDSNLGAHTYAGNAEGKVIVSIHSSQELPIICICVFSGNSLAWYWYASDCQHQVRWIFYSEDPKSFMEKRIDCPELSRIFGAFRCVRGSIRERAVAIAAHSQVSTMWCAIALRLLRVPTPLLSFSFHFSGLPTGIRRALLSWALV